jgi:hypothetical protein
MLGAQVWPALITHSGAWDPVKGVAFACWATLSTLAALGLRHPLKMLPLLLFQFLYKSIWIIAIAYPLWSSFRSLELTRVMGYGALVDLAVIPWPYVWTNYVKSAGDRWR